MRLVLNLRIFLNDMELTEIEIKKVILEILEDIYLNKKNIIDNKLHERTIVADYIAPALRSKFTDFEVNTDYNREGTGRDPKTDLSGNKVVPDIVIHHQGIDEYNLVAMEVKGFWNNQERRIDEEKLQSLNKKHPYKFLFRIELGKEEPEIVTISK